MKVDVIASDLDGTLLHDDKQLSEYTLETVRECLRRGIRFIPCSGRTRESMRRYVKQLGTEMPYIGGNGSELMGGDHRYLEQVFFDGDTVRSICAHYEGLGLHVQVYREDEFLYSRENKYSRMYAKGSGMKGVELGDLVARLNFPTPKVLVIAEPEEIQRQLSPARKRFGSAASISVSGAQFLEFEPAGVDKGSGLKRLAALTGFDLSRTLAFGDNLNDVPLLNAAGYSCAVANASADAAAAAGYRCGSNNEDGPARFIREHVLNESEAGA